MKLTYLILGTSNILISLLRLCFTTALHIHPNSLVATFLEGSRIGQLGIESATDLSLIKRMNYNEDSVGEAFILRRNPRQDSQNIMQATVIESGKDSTDYIRNYQTNIAPNIASNAGDIPCNKVAVAETLGKIDQTLKNIETTKTEIRSEIKDLEMKEGALSSKIQNLDEEINKREQKLVQIKAETAQTLQASKAQSINPNGKPSNLRIHKKGKTSSDSSKSNKRQLIYTECLLLANTVQDFSSCRTNYLHLVSTQNSNYQTYVGLSEFDLGFVNNEIFDSITSSKSKNKLAQISNNTIYLESNILTNSSIFSIPYTRLYSTESCDLKIDLIRQGMAKESSNRVCLALEILKYHKMIITSRKPLEEMENELGEKYASSLFFAVNFEFFKQNSETYSALNSPNFQYQKLTSYLSYVSTVKKQTFISEHNLLKVIQNSLANSQINYAKQFPFEFGLDDYMKARIFVSKYAMKKDKHLLMLPVIQQLDSNYYKAGSKKKFIPNSNVKVLDSSVDLVASIDISKETNLIFDYSEVIRMKPSYQYYNSIFYLGVVPDFSLKGFKYAYHVKIPIKLTDVSLILSTYSLPNSQTESYKNLVGKVVQAEKEYLLLSIESPFSEDIEPFRKWAYSSNTRECKDSLYFQAKIKKSDLTSLKFHSTINCLSNEIAALQAFKNVIQTFLNELPQYSKASNSNSRSKRLTVETQYLIAEGNERLFLTSYLDFIHETLEKHQALSTTELSQVAAAKDKAKKQSIQKFVDYYKNEFKLILESPPTEEHQFYILNDSSNHKLIYEINALAE